ncbi:MAG: LysM peptidoglycan-binding domain-containing protein [Thermoleophilia bacterium]|nr:LysM peptidoglycan-binding domain-containing protein [Thermoleophilia bacterium]
MPVAPREQPLPYGPREQPPPDARPLPGSRRPRPALAPDRSARLARLVAPVVFLAAVLVVFSLAWRTGVVGDGADGAPVASPSPKASAKKTPTEEPSDEPDAGSETRTYKVKAGDTLSGIAERFDTTVTKLEDLNADQDLQTLNPGQELTVPSP